MKKILSLLLLCAATASAGTYTTNLNLYKPAIGDTNYVTPFATGMDTIDSYLWTTANNVTVENLAQENVAAAAGTCITGSTITLTTAGSSKALMTFDATFTITNSLFITFVVDGVELYTRPRAAKGASVAGTYASITVIRESGTLSAGTHTFCVAARKDAGTSTILYGTEFTSMFRVQEIR